MTKSMDSTGAAKLARKRAASLSPERRQEIAREAAKERWNREIGDVSNDIPKAEFPGELEIGELTIPCAVLDNGMRVLSERGVTQALGGKRGGSHWKRQKALPDGTRLPVFLSATNLAPFIRPSLRMALSNPVRYKGKSAGFGYEATLIPEICEVLLEARRKKALAPSQEHLAERAEVLMGGLARVGIIALVDAATGYEKVRDRAELRRILEAYISKELLPWSRRFPSEFYEEMFRLRGWSYSPPQPKRPRLIGKLTNQLVYDKLPRGVLGELKRLNPVGRTGRRQHKFHQFLTGDVGNPHLANQILAVTTLMKAAPAWGAFKKMFARAFPDGQIEMDLEVDGEDY
ncbi:MAG: P63C domain-containing protein [Dehalococcoidia bacterium]|nr:P63C domain-containing protein [Dehalococcoidia bacterium]